MLKSECESISQLLGFSKECVPCEVPVNLTLNAFKTSKLFSYLSFPLHAKLYWDDFVKKQHLRQEYAYCVSKKGMMPFIFVSRANKPLLGQNIMCEDAHTHTHMRKREGGEERENMAPVLT